MNVSILSLRRHSDPGEIFPATVRIKVQLVANSVYCIRTKKDRNLERSVLIVWTSPQIVGRLLPWFTLIWNMNKMQKLKQ